MDTPGLELLFHSLENQLKRPQDALMTVFHWCLVSNGLKCVGTGEEAKQTDKESEMLPRGWNSSPDLYTLRYQKSKSSGVTYLFKVIRVDSDLLLHLMDTSSDKVTTMNVRTSDYVTDDYTSYEAAFRNIEDLCKAFKKDIVQDIITKKKKEPSPERKTSPRQSGSRSDDHDPLRVPPRRTQRPPPEWADPGDPFAIGRSDLDPFARGPGGGMLFDPMRSAPGRHPDPSAGLPRRLPPGAVPPGARFDPFGPPGTGPGPDPDHLPPPGYDDMFM